MAKAKQAIDFIETLNVPEGPKAGKRIKLAPFQRKFIKGSLKRGNRIGVLSVARGNGKSAISGGLALGHLVGAWDDQPRREIIVAARTQAQANIVWNYVAGLALSLDPAIYERLTFRRGQRLEIAFDGDHVIKCISAQPQNALGTSPTLCIMDERAHWDDAKGDELESALLSGLGKRDGTALMISTSASSNAHSFSRWLDDPPVHSYVQEHRPQPGLPVDDMASILLANPGAKHGIGSSPQWLEAQAAMAIARGGSVLSKFRLYNRNERTSGERRDRLMTLDEWLEVESSEPPPREGHAIVGIDLGGTASMSAAAMYWPSSGRLEVFGAFGSDPTLEDRGQRDAVGDGYVEMAGRGELVTMGQKVVPADSFIAEIVKRLDGWPMACIVGDRYRKGEFQEALFAAGVRVPIVWRGNGFKDGGEDTARFTKAVFDGRVSMAPSRLMASAINDCVVVTDDSGNSKLTKKRSLGRIDPVSAASLAIAEGVRRMDRPVTQAKGLTWA